MRSLFALLFTSFLFISAPSLAVNADQPQSDEDKIKQLEADVAFLKQQFMILNRNQQGIAKHVGLTGGEPKQPALPIANSAQIGSTEAPIVLMEFTDLHCPFCAKFQKNTFPQIKENYINNKQLLFVGKHLPIPSLHPDAKLAAQALECARAQGHYEEAKAWLFSNKKLFKADNLSGFINAIALDTTRFNSCISSPEVVAQVDSDMKLAAQLGLKGTPNFIIGQLKDGKVYEWRIISGAKSYDTFKKVIDQLLQKTAQQ